MKDKLEKCKRPRVHWVQVIKSIGDPYLLQYYFNYLEQHRRMSCNRCAWNVLKLHYSTTALANFRYSQVPLGAPRCRYGL